jgi:ferredoxin
MSRIRERDSALHPDDDGYAEAMPDELAAEFEGAVRDAIEACPEHAITRV